MAHVDRPRSGDGDSCVVIDLERSREADDNELFYEEFVLLMKLEKVKTC
jgi:hypothetical protein